MNKPLTPVVFRIDTTEDGPPNEVIAVFPHDVTSWPQRNVVTCYVHAGQHGRIHREYYLKHTRPAKPDEYAGLKRELESIRYRLKVVTRWRI